MSKIEFCTYFQRNNVFLKCMPFLSDWCFLKLITAKSTKKRKEKDTKSKILMLQDQFETHFPKKANYKIE